ncbi:MAG TPA: peroxidase family protein, partial [Gemmataceae bacterium]|nr:peroxidase family protein [Gemmataceae bacterium]
MSKKLHLVRKPLVKARRRRAGPLRLEALEERYVLDVRSITGFGNNIANPTEGMGNTDLLRVSPVAYADGISAPSTPNTLSPRLISNNLNNQSSAIFQFTNDLGNPNSQRLSDYAYAFGQFIDHDMDLTLDNSGTAFNIPADTRTFTLPDGTKVTDPMGVEPFTRSQFDPKTGMSKSNPRQQINLDTSFLDLSQVYGSTDAVSSILRTHSGGQLRSSPGGFLPRESDFTAAELATLNHDEGGIANDAQQVPDSQLFVAGDKRVNENVELTSQQTLFMRNHNRLAAQLQANHPGWTDEQLFQEARKINIAEYQNIVFNGYVPSIIGTNGLAAYSGYKPGVDAAISTEFSTVGFRFGHTLLSNGVGRLNNDGTPITDVNPNGSTVNLAIDFFRPDLLNNNHVTVNLLDRFGNTDPHTSSTVGEVLKALADGL